MATGWIHGHGILATIPLLTGLYLTIPIVFPFNCDASWAQIAGIVLEASFATLYLLMNIPLLLGIRTAIWLYPVWMLGILVHCFFGEYWMKVEPRY